MEGFVSSVISGFSNVVGKLLGHPLDFLAGKSCNTKCQPIWDIFCYIENFCISHLLKLVLVIVLLYFVLLFFYLSFKLGICQCICHTCCRSIWAFFGMYFYMIEYCCSFLCLNLEKHNQRRRMKRARDIEEFVIGSDDHDDDDKEEKDWEGSTSSFSSSSEEEEKEEQRRDNEIQQQQQRRRKRLRCDRNGEREIEIEIEGRKRLGGGSYRRREYRREEYLRRALRPKHHEIQVRRLSSRGDSICLREKKWMKKGGDYYYPTSTSPVDHITTVTRTSKFAHKRGSFRKASSRYMRHPYVNVNSYY